jgi:hypothetical protein
VSPARALRAAIFVLLAGTLLHHLRGYAHEDLAGHAAGSDDAYISYRYARSLAGGGGLAFNPGERVEGYSNLLFVLLIAPAFLVLRDAAVHTWAVALSALFAACALVVFHRRLLALDERVATWGTLALAASPPLWLWTASGMETALVLLLQVALWSEVVGGREGRRLAAVIVLLLLSRADGFVGAGIAVAYLAARRDRRAIAAGAALAITMAVLTGWRLAYYGWPFPNTYYAKVSGALGERIPAALAQLADLAWMVGLAAPLAVLAVDAAAGLRARRIAFEPFFAAVWLGFWISVGGDVFAERFLVVLVPLAIAVLARAARGGRPALAYAGLAAIALAQLVPLAADRRFRYAGEKYDRWIEVGRTLSAPEHRGRTIAVDAAGKIPFYSRLFAIDMLGLNDAHIAHRPASEFRVGHSKHDVDYVLGRRPDLIATWIDPDLDMRWGLDRGRYEAAGYRLRYLAWARRSPPAPATVDLRTVDPAEVPDLVRRGYQYAVAERVRD